MSDSEREASSDEDHYIISSDEENEYITKEKLIEELKDLISKIKTEKMSRSHLQDIHDSIEEYVTGVEKSLDPQVVSYLIQGWMVANDIKNPYINQTV